MPKYITKEEVRDITGLDDEIDDDALNEIIEGVESQVKRFLNTELEPEEKIEFKNGTDNGRISLDNNPVLGVREIKIDETDLTVDDNINYKESGTVVIDLNGSPEIGRFSKGINNVVIRYLYGFMEYSDIKTKTDSDVEPGTNVEIEVDDASDFRDERWITIFGMDGQKEAAEIKSVDGNKLTVDELAFSHNSGSMVIELDIQPLVKRLLRVVAGITAALRMIGQTYTFSTGYTLGEMSVQKGVPYTHWQAMVKELIKERDRIFERLQPRISIK
ncbi:MAG: phage head-tail connector protein [archaeon]